MANVRQCSISISEPNSSKYTKERSWLCKSTAPVPQTCLMSRAHFSRLPHQSRTKAMHLRIYTFRGDSSDQSKQWLMHATVQPFMHVSLFATSAHACMRIYPPQPLVHACKSDHNNHSCNKSTRAIKWVSFTMRCMDECHPDCFTRWHSGQAFNDIYRRA